MCFKYISTAQIIQSSFVNHNLWLS